MTRRRVTPQHEDSGAALLLAIGFVMMIGLISAGLASLATSSLQNRATLELVRDRQYAADGAIEQAVLQVSGYTCDTVPSAPIVNTLNGVAIRVDWANACGSVKTSDDSPYLQRNVIFNACVDTGKPCSNPDVIIRAQVNFDPATGPVTKTYVQSWSVNR
jgi:hypothetical protein